MVKVKTGDRLLFLGYWITRLPTPASLVFQAARANASSLAFVVLCDLRSSSTASSRSLLVVPSNLFRPIIDTLLDGLLNDNIHPFGLYYSPMYLWWTCRHMLAGSEPRFTHLHTMIISKSVLFWLLAYAYQHTDSVLIPCSDFRFCHNTLFNKTYLSDHLSFKYFNSSLVVFKRFWRMN